MEIRRIAPNISSDKMEAGKKFNRAFLGLHKSVL